MSNDRDFLGKGLRFPVSVNLNGGVSSSQLEENVRQSIFIILGTAPGERINRPDFGVAISAILMRPLPKTIALGGVATGIIKAHDADSVAGIIISNGLIRSSTESAARIGRII